jgi:3-hydroxyisobutyrate dehydrogenase
MTKIAFLGTGTMGMPMARNLARAGFELRAWNRGADLPITMLSDTEHPRVAPSRVPVGPAGERPVGCMVPREIG